MNRFWVRTIVFCGLLGAAGLAWGVLECAMFTRVGIDYLEGPKSNAAFAYPIAIALVLVAYWSAAQSILRDQWRTAELLAAMLSPLSCSMVGFSTAAILSMLDRFGVWEYTTAALLVLMIAIFILTAIRHRRARRELPSQPRPDWRQSVPSALCFTGAVVIWWFWVARISGRTFYSMGAFGGMSLPAARQMAGLTDLNLATWLLDSLIAGGVLGIMAGFFITVSVMRRNRARKELLCLAVCGVLGAVVSGVGYAANALLILRSYAVACNERALLPTALWICGISGLLLGLMLTSIVHVLSAPEPKVRIRRLAVCATIVVAMLIMGTAFTCSSARTSSTGLDLLQKAAQLEGQALCIGFNGDEHHSGQRQIIVLGGSTTPTYHSQGACEHTIQACTTIIDHCPNSAFTPAALYLKFRCCQSNWQPAESQRALDRLRKNYPHQGYDTSRVGARLDAAWELSNVMLLGEYGKVVMEAQSHPMTAETISPGAKARAAEALGRWDVAVRARSAIMDWYAQNSAKQSTRTETAMSKARSQLEHDQQMQARHAPPPPRTNVTGRLLLGSRPLANAAICLLPADRLPSPGEGIGPTTAGNQGGRVARADEAGRYAVQSVPSGRYAVVLIVQRNSAPKDLNVHAPGVPYDIRGKSMRLPDIVLVPKPAK